MSRPTIDQRDFARAPEDFAPEVFAPEDFAEAVFADEAFAFGAAFLVDAALAFGFAVAAAAERSEPAFAEVVAFGLALAFAFAFGREVLAVDLPAIVSFTASSALAPARATASAPSTTVSPIERRTPLAPRPAAAAPFFTRFAAGPAVFDAALPARPSVPLLLFLP